MKNVRKQIPELSETDKARFWAFVEKRPDGIWAWTGHKVRCGYGVIKLHQVAYYAHRIAWALNERENGRTGFIPDDLCVLHKIDVTRAVFDVNPDNLWIGTHRNNMEDMVAKGRAKGGSGDRAGARTHPEKIPRGEKHGLSKLKETEIPKIRRLHKLGYGSGKIAKMFHVAKPTIQQILIGKTWGHVA